jgi:hypothetical protein
MAVAYGHPLIENGTPVKISWADGKGTVVGHIPEACHNAEQFGSGGFKGYCYDVEVRKSGRPPRTVAARPTEIEVIE